MSLVIDMVHCIEYGSVLEIGECVWERKRIIRYGMISKANICLLSTIRNVIWLDRKWKFGISNTGDGLIRTVTDTNRSLYINEITIYVIIIFFFLALIVNTFNDIINLKMRRKKKRKKNDYYLIDGIEIRTIPDRTFKHATKNDIFCCCYCFWLFATLQILIV